MLLPRAVQDVDGAALLEGGDRRGRVALGEADDRGGVGDVDRAAQREVDLLAVAGGREVQPRHDVGQGHVPHAVVRRAVRPGHAGPIQHEGHARPVQRTVHEQLVEGAVEESRVDRHDRVQPGVGQTRGHGHGVLLGDADVDDPLGELEGEVAQPDGDEHGGGQGHHVVALLAEGDQRVGKVVGPGAARHLEGQAGLGVDDAHRVELVVRVLAGGAVALALLGQDVDQHRRAVALGLAQRHLEGVLVVPVDRTDILDAEVLEEPLRRDDVLETLLDPVQGLEGGAPDHGSPRDGALADAQHPLVALGGAQRRQVLGEPARGGGVGPLVVVDDHDEGQVLAGGDVVERLPGHAAGQGPVADDGDRVPLAVTRELVGDGDPLGPGQGGRRVGVLDHVVLGLGAGRVAGEPALGAQGREVLPPGQQFVDIADVSGVVDDRVVRRLEDAVQRDGQLDDAEVGAEVPARPGHLVDQELPDLRRQGGEARGGQPTQCRRAGDGREHTLSHEWIRLLRKRTRLASLDQRVVPDGRGGLRAGARTGAPAWPRARGGRCAPWLAGAPPPPRGRP